MIRIGILFIFSLLCISLYSQDLNEKEVAHKPETSIYDYLTSVGNYLTSASWEILGKGYELAGQDEKAMEYYKTAQLINPYEKSVTDKIFALQKKMDEDKKNDNIKPEIELYSPKADNILGKIKFYKEAKSEEGMLMISGIVRNGGLGLKWLKVNGEDVDFLSDKDGYFRTNIDEVSKTLNIEAMDKKNHSTTLSYEITTQSKKINEKQIPLEMNNTLKTKEVYHAILIACSNYNSLASNLNSTIEDARAFKKTLLNSYDFKESNIDSLYDNSKNEILTKISNKLKDLKENDNLIIFFAGHGTYYDYKIDNNSNTETEGYWVAMENKTKLGYISNEVLANLISFHGVRAKNILIISDACYSKAIKSKVVNKENRSRQILTSGGFEVVNGRSYFMTALLKYLEENKDDKYSVEEIHNKILDWAIKAQKEAKENSIKLNITRPKLFDFGFNSPRAEDFIFKRKE